MSAKRTEPTWRIPIGMLALCLYIALYTGLAVTLVAPLIGDWPGLAQAPVYLVLGFIWVLPLKRFLIWMETGSWSVPPRA